MIQVLVLSNFPMVHRLIWPSAMFGEFHLSISCRSDWKFHLEIAIPDFLSCLEDTEEPQCLIMAQIMFRRL